MKEGKYVPEGLQFRGRSAYPECRKAGAIFAETRIEELI